MTYTKIEIVKQGNDWCETDHTIEGNFATEQEATELATRLGYKVEGSDTFAREGKIIVFVTGDAA